ncbi:MAG: hypothetical protein ACPGQS_12485 [Bradymonadia bacterium]
MSIYLRCVLVSSFISACQPTANETAKKVSPGTPTVVKSQPSKGTELVEAYKEGLTLAIEGLNQASIAPSTKATVSKLFKLGREVAELIRRERLQCEAYLKTLLARENELLALSAEAIEAGYHRDGELPNTKEPICHHAKDLVVHPATVLILMKQTPPAKRELMLRELVELTGHLAEVAAQLTNKTAN